MAGHPPPLPPLHTGFFRESGAIVVEVSAALRPHEFHTLASPRTPGWRPHGDPRGIVIHAREFPGWENLGSFLGHIRFIRNHHRKVARIALAAA